MLIPNRQTDRTLIVAASLLGFLLLTGLTLVGVLVVIPESQNPATIIVIVLGFLGTILTAMTNSLLGGRTNEKLDRVLNGEMDRKIESAVHRVLDDREPLSVEYTDESDGQR